MPAQRHARPRIVAAALIALAACAITGAQTPAPDLFDEIYERGRAVDASWKTMTAAFTETSTSSLLATPLRATGTLAVARPDRIAMHYDEPDGRTIVIDGHTLTLVWPSRGLRTATDVSATQRRIQKYFVNKSPRELRRQFTIVARVAPDRAGTWYLALVPTQQRLQEGIAEIDLWVDRQTLLLSAMSLRFPNGDRKLLEFSGVRLNPIVPAGTFVAPPA